MLEIVIDGVGAVLAVVALIMSIIVARLVILQTHRLHEESHAVAVEEFQRSRFDILFAAIDKVLGSIADLKTDLLPYWTETDDSLAKKKESGEMLAYDVNVHRAMEHFIANRKSLAIALVGLPALTVASGVTMQDTALDENRSRLEFASSWLGGCAMTAYFSLVNRSLNGGTTEQETDSLVFGKIENEWDKKNGSDPKDVRVAFLQEIVTDWQRFRTDQSNRRLAAIEPGTDVPDHVPDGAPNVAFTFLERAESALVNEAKNLSTAFSASQAASAQAIRQRGRAASWLKAAY